MVVASPRNADSGRGPLPPATLTWCVKGRYVTNTERIERGVTIRPDLWRAARGAHKTYARVNARLYSTRRRLPSTMCVVRIRAILICIPDLFIVAQAHLLHLRASREDWIFFFSTAENLPRLLTFLRARPLDFSIIIIVTPRDFRISLRDCLPHRSILLPDEIKLNRAK